MQMIICNKCGGYHRCGIIGMLCDKYGPIPVGIGIPVYVIGVPCIGVGLMLPCWYFGVWFLSLAIFAVATEVYEGYVVTYRSLDNNAHDCQCDRKRLMKQLRRMK